MPARRKHIVKVSRKAIYLDGKPIPLLSGEIHYWRLNPKYWGKCLDEFRNMDLEIVSTYVCWDFCEVAPGKFDFTGETSPQHDLVGFVKLAASKGLWVIYRPGPYIYSEWDEMGIPKYAAACHRDSDEFKRLALPYMKAATDAVRNMQATSGGPIILWQADNEIDFMPWAFEGDLGLADDPGDFQKFLEETYHDVERLNHAWSTSYKRFSDARATRGRRIKGPPYHRRYLDYMRYRHRYNDKHARWMVEAYRSLGVRVPIYLNSYPHQDSLDWRGLQNIADIVGIDPYPANEFSDDEGDHKRFVEKIVFQNCYAKAPYIAEYEAGVWYGHHKFTGLLTANHYRLSCLSAMGGGIAGWNWYMLVNRDNWVFSPINERGVPNHDTAPAFGEIVRLFRKMDAPRLKRITNTAATFELMHHAIRDLSDDDAALNGLYRASIPYEFYDLRTGDIEKPLVIYSGPDWLSTSSAEKLKSYVEEGGDLAMFINYPRHDEDYRPREMFGIPRPDMVLPEKRLKFRLGNRTLELTTEAFAFAKLPGRGIAASNVPTVNCEQAGVSAGEKYLIGCVRRVGKGRILFLAVQPDAETLLTVHEYFGISVPCRSLADGAHATLLRRNTRTSFIVVVNMNDCSTVVPVRLDREIFSTGKPKFSNLSTGEQIAAIADEKGIVAYVPVNRKDGVVVKVVC